MTWLSARRYLARYSYLGNEYGRKGKSAITDAREHWYNNGSKMSPPLSVAPAYASEEPWKCGDYGDDCKCPGRVHLGLKYRADSGDEITTLYDLMDWNKAQKKDGGMTKVTCNRNGFGARGLWSGKGKDLQCFCEPDPRPEPFHCAGELETCECPKGNVFFGQRYVEGTAKLSNFEQMMSAEYTVAKAGKGKKGSVVCDAASFVGGDPLPGYAKDCYCDTLGVAPADVVDDQIAYWQGRLDEAAAAEAEAKAEAEAEAARLAAAEEAAALKADLAAAQARIKAAQEAYAKAQEDAAKKAEEQAAKDKAEAAAVAAAEAARAKEEAAQAAEREKAHQAALQAAEAAALAAAKSEHADEKRRLLAEAAKAKEAAVKAEVAAALASQKEEHDRLVAEQAAKAEADRRAQEAAAAEAKRLEEAEEAKEKALEEAKR